jgi:subtilisin family serine protease
MNAEILRGHPIRSNAAAALVALAVCWPGCATAASSVDQPPEERRPIDLNRNRVPRGASLGPGEGRGICSPDGSGIACSATEGVGVTPHRLVVKFRSAFREPPDLAHDAGLSFTNIAPAGGADLDRAIARFGVRLVEPVFGHLFTPADRRVGVRAGAERQRRFRAAVDRARAAFRRRALRAPAFAESPDLTRVFTLELAPGADLDEAARAFAASAAVEWAVPDGVARVQALPSDPYLATSGSWGQTYVDLWALGVIRAPEAWSSSAGAGAVVAVIDTGLDWAHPDAAASVWTNAAESAGLEGVDDDLNGLVDDVRGWDFAYGDADVTDRHGHGTHVAGSIAAAGDNGVGIIGVAYGARIMAVKGMGDDGTGQFAHLADAIAYAAMAGADVINASWGCFGNGCNSPVIADAFALARSLGCVVVVAAGNDGSDVRDAFPASLPDVLTVSATGVDDSVPKFSNRGWLVDLAAPGGGPGSGALAGANILSLRAGGTGEQPFVVGIDYVRQFGTSMAAAHAAGAAALVVSANPDLTVAEVESVLRHSAADQVGDPVLDVLGYDPHYGWGRLDVAAAVALAPVPPDDAPILKVVAEPLSFDLPGSDCGGSRSLGVDVYNIGGGGLSWSASEADGIAVAPAAGATPAMARLTMTQGGNWSGTLTIDAEGARDGRVELPVVQRIADGLRIRNCDPSLARAASTQDWAPALGGPPAGPGVPDGAGGAVYVWVDGRNGNADLYAQRVDAEGRAVWTAGGVQVTSPAGVEYQPVLVSDGAGGAVIAWAEGPWSADLESQSHIRAQRLSASGEKMFGDDGVWLSRAEGGQQKPAIASDGAGGAIVAWVDRRSGAFNVYAQRITASGTPMWLEGGVAIAKEFHFQYDPSIAADGQGGAFVAWVDAREPFWAIYAQRVDASGFARWVEDGIRVSPQPTNGATIVADGAGGAYVAWRDRRHVPLEPGLNVVARSDVYAARLDGDGHPLWTEGGVPVTEGATASPSKILPGLEPSAVTLAPDGRGGLFFAWMDGRAGGWHAYAQRLAPDGRRLWGPAGLPVVSARSDQLAPAVMADGADGAIFAWTDFRPGQSDIFVQRLGPEGQRLLPDGGSWLASKPGDQANPFIVPVDAGRRFLISWDDQGNCAGEGCSDTGADIAGMVVDLEEEERPPDVVRHPQSGCSCNSSAGATPLGVAVAVLLLRRARPRRDDEA